LRPLLLYLLVALAGAPAFAQRGASCVADGPRPVVCSLRFQVAVGDERWQSFDLDGDALQIPAGERAVLRPEAFDQNGRRFPEDRLWVGLETDRSCRGLVEVERSEDDSLVLRAGSTRGRCRALVWIPGNLNLEFPLDLEVVSRARDGYSRGEAEHIAERLYWAILGREPDPAGLRAAVVEVQRGRLQAQIEAMLRSPEFTRDSGSLPAPELLDRIYQGLLGRSPDSGGVRTYLDQVSRGRAAQVVLSIVRSEEFEEQLLHKRAD
jgi:hypothetical protein